MSSFVRDITETLTFADFLNANGNLGFGMPVGMFLGNTDSYGMYFSQAAQNADAFGDYDLGSAWNFVPVGRESELSARLFTDNGQTSSTAANFFDPLGDQFDDSWGLNFNRPLSEILSFASDVDFDGDYVRPLMETLAVLGRVGAAKGLFFRETLSDIVTANNEIRQLLTTPGSGEIAASERLTAGPLKIMRYVPGTTPGTANTIDLGAIPTDVGSQGFLFDDSQQGVFLRGDWEVKLIVSDTQATGSVRVAVNMFVVTASTGSVNKIVQIGATKFSSPFSPAVTPSQLIFSWNYGEVGEIFVDTDQFLYVEVVLEELAHPSGLAFAKMRLDDLPGLLFSEMRTPGVSAETTYYAAPADETLSVLDAVAFIKGYNRDLAETLTFTDAVAQNIALQRALSESISISDLIFAAKNVLYETLAISDSLDRLTNYLRPLAETLSIADFVAVGALATNYNLVENLNIQDFASFSITRPERPLKIGGLNKRPLHPIRQSKFRGLK